MGFSIRSVSLWADPGFTEGGVDVPSASSQPSLWTRSANAIFTDTDVRVPKGRLFSEMILPLTVEEVSGGNNNTMKKSVMNASYLSMLLSRSDGGDVEYPYVTVYGWIDNIELVSANDDAPATRISWHVDWWRTCISYASIFRGRVKRRAASLRPYPPQDPSSILMVPVEYEYPGQAVYNTIDFTHVNSIYSHDADGNPVYRDDNNLAWVIISYVETDSVKTGSDSNGDIYSVVNSSDVKILQSPINRKGGLGCQINLTNSADPSENGTYRTFSLSSYASGTAGYDLLGIRPSQIVGVWVSPIPLVTPWLPNYVYGGGDDGRQTLTMDLYVAAHVGYEIRQTAGGLAKYLWFEASMSSFTRLYPLGTVLTDDKKIWKFLDVDGSPVGVMPYGIGSDIIETSVAYNHTSAYLVVRMLNAKSYESSSASALAPDKSNANGTEFHIPLRSVSVASNAWSEYLYSGEREYDIEMRKTQQDIAYDKGILNVKTSALQGAGVGMLASYPGTALATAAFSAAAAYTNAYGTREIDRGYNGALQDLEDMKTARQSNNIIMAGDGIYWMDDGYANVPLLVAYQPDSYSLSRFEKSLELDGVRVDEPSLNVTADCITPLLSDVSKPAIPLKVDDPEIRGNIPNAARDYIAARLRAGVRMIQPGGQYDTTTGAKS